MKKNFFNQVKIILRASTPTEKLNLFNQFLNEFHNNIFSFEPLDNIEIFTEPSYKSFCKIVDPKKVPTRKNLGSDDGKKVLLHAIAHIEYNAIDLALDACYRFQNMPQRFYQDWIEVAHDEVRHFLMITDKLKTFNISYGDLPVHQGLFDASMKTLELIPRMALIPRYMEANGLDANLMIINKLKKLPNSSEIIDLLNIILEEEIDHVKKGDFWYKWGCSKKTDFKCDYFKIINNIYPNSFNTKKLINKQARLKAGFSEDEIKKLNQFY